MLPSASTGTRQRLRVLVLLALLVSVPLGSSSSAAAWVVSGQNGANTFTTADWLQITLSPTSGHKSVTITISGSGFAPNSTLSVTYGGSATPWTSNGGSETSAGDGTIPAGATIKAGSGASGNYTVTVSDAAGNSASAVYDQTN